MVVISDVSGTEKVKYGRVREFPKLEKSGSSFVGNYSFQDFRVSGMKFWVSGFFRVFREKLKIL